VRIRVLNRGGWLQPSELLRNGAVGPPRPAIFIDGRELEKFMGRSSSENGVFEGPNSVRPMVFVRLSGLVGEGGHGLDPSASSFTAAI